MNSSRIADGAKRVALHQDQGNVVTMILLWLHAKMTLIGTL